MQKYGLNRGKSTFHLRRICRIVHLGNNIPVDWAENVDETCENRIQVIVDAPKQSSIHLFSFLQKDRHARYGPTKTPLHAPGTFPITTRRHRTQGQCTTVVVLHLKNSDPRILYPTIGRPYRRGWLLSASAPVLIDVTALDSDARYAGFSYLSGTCAVRN